MAGTLYLVATPIGNLGDLSLRAAETLEQVDFIAAEDTRVTVKLLNHLGLKKPMVSYYRHNTGTRGEELIARLLGGESCALGHQFLSRVTDGPVRSAGDSRGSHPRPLCLCQRAGGVRSAHGTVYL